MIQPFSGLNPLPPDYGDNIGSGTEVIMVTDKRLAAALIAVGCHLRRDPPYVMIEYADGSKQTTFHFLPMDVDGILRTEDLIKAWSEDLTFLEANPHHPFTFAMCALRNYQQILEHLTNNVPYVQFHAKYQGRQAILMVKKGSRKEEAARKRGLQQI